MTPVAGRTSRWRPLRRGLPIRLRLTLWYVALLAVILGVFSVYLYFSLARNLGDEQDALLAASAGQVRASLDNEGGSLRLERDTGPLPPGVAVALYDRSGERLEAGAPRWPVSALAGVMTRARLGRSSTGVVRLDNGEGWRVLVAPVEENGRTLGFLAVGVPERESEAALAELLGLMGLAVPATLLVAALFGLFLAQRALSPIDRITSTARRIGGGDLSRRIGLPRSDDEVGRLAATLDEMLARLEAAFERQRRFTADASHELRTPLAVVRAHADLALERPRGGDEYREALGVVRAEAERMGVLVDGLLMLARADAGHLSLECELVPLDELAAEVALQMGPLAAARGLALETGPCDRAVVAGDRTRLLQLLFNLADNAIKYTAPGGRVEIAVSRRDGRARLSVSDTGIGIAAGHLPHLRERFYRVDKARSRAEGGAGLGLAICDWIARAHQGSIEVASAPGRGSTFTVSLPLAPAR